MTVTKTQELDAGLLNSLLADESFWPSEPGSIQDTGVTETLIESLICKYLLVSGTNSGRRIAEYLCVPYGVLSEQLGILRTRQIIVHAGAAPFNDYYYSLTERGRQHAQAYNRSCAYVGPAPVPLMDYVLSVEAQAISSESIQRDQLTHAFRDISIDTDLFEQLGPAVNSGAGMFLYGSPGNGKSTLAKRITMCFGQEIWIPHCVIEDGHIVKLFDASYHKVANNQRTSQLQLQDFDRRWIRIRRPTVVVGGELTMDSLEIRHNPKTNISEAPLQMKSNGGCLLIDDFGRQRIAPAELLNRWIIPLENHHDYLTLATGKKVQIPFEQLIIFSTNMEPSDLVDEAFLRRIPYKIEIGDPSPEEFHQLFQLYADNMGFEYRSDVVDGLLQQHYRQSDQPMRRCHPRDLLSQIRHLCTYNNLPMEMRPEYFDRVANSYFANVLRKKTSSD